MVRQALRDLASGIANQVTRAKLALSAYSAGGQRTIVQVTGLFGETHQRVELLLPYGMSALPVGQSADLIIFQVNGHRDHKVAFAADDPALRIPDLQPGEIGLRDHNGQQIVLRKDHVEITTPGTAGVQINLSGGSFALDKNANLTTTGNITAGYGTGDSVTLQHHTHNQPADSHGDSEAATNPPNAGT